MPPPSERSHHPDYGRLTAYLRRRRQPCITLTFAQLEEEILLGLLPWAARVYPGWWSNALLIQTPSELGLHIRVVEVAEKLPSNPRQT
jgi:hypothetical protein